MEALLYINAFRLSLSLCLAADFPLISAARQSLTFQREHQTHGRAISRRQGGGPEWVAYVTAHMLIRTPPHTDTATHAQRGVREVSPIVIPLSKSLIFRISASYTLPLSGFPAMSE